MTPEVAQPTRISKYCSANPRITQKKLSERYVSPVKGRGHNSRPRNDMQSTPTKKNTLATSNTGANIKQSLTFMLERSCLPRWMRPSLSPNWFAETFFVFLVSVLLNRQTSTRHHTSHKQEKLSETSKHQAAGRKKQRRAEAIPIETATQPTYCRCPTASMTHSSHVAPFGQTFCCWKMYPGKADPINSLPQVGPLSIPTQE